MQTLKTELEDLIALTKEYLSSQAPAPAAAAASTSASSASASTSASTTPKPGSGSAAASSKAKPAAPAPASGAKVSYKPGDECSCRYSDGKWYPARITQISGSTDQPVYTVVFKGYDTPEVVTMNDIRPLNKWDSGTAGARAGATGGGAGGEKRKAGEPTKEDLEKERKKKKNEKKAETLKAKAEEQAAKQKGWQAFAKKGTKKGIHIPGVKGQSPVSSPFTIDPRRWRSCFRPS